MNIKPIDSKSFWKVLKGTWDLICSTCKTIFIILTILAYIFAWKHIQTRKQEIIRVFSADRTTYINSPIVVEAQGKAE